MPIFSVPTGLSTLQASKTYNAGWYRQTGDTNAQTVQRAIDRGVADNAVNPGSCLIIYVPLSLLPYDPSQVVHSTSIKMVREGGNQEAYDVVAYGGRQTNGDVTVAMQRAIEAAVANGGGTIDAMTPYGSSFIGLTADMFGNVLTYSRASLTFLWGPNEVRLSAKQGLRSHTHHVLHGTTFTSKNLDGTQSNGNGMFEFLGIVDTANLILVDGSGVVTKSTPTNPIWGMLEIGSPINIFGRFTTIGKDNTTINIGGGIDASTTSITVTSTTGFPANGYLRCEDEVITYTSVDATHFLGCVRGFGGSVAAAHANTTAIERCTYEPFFVESISGNALTLGNDEVMDMAASNMSACLGPIDISFDGVGVFDGNYTRGVNDSGNQMGIRIWHGRHLYIGKGLTFTNFDHGAVDFQGCQDFNVNGRYYYNTQPALALGTSIWLFGRNKRGTIDVDIEDSYRGIMVDDRSTVAQLRDGPSEFIDATVRSSRRVINAVIHGSGMKNCRFETGVVQGLTNGPAILWEDGASQWITNAAGDGNVAETACVEGTGTATAFSAASGYADKANVYINKGTLGIARSYTVTEGASSSSGLNIIRPSRAFQASFPGGGGAPTPDFKFGDVCIIQVTDAVAFTINAPLNPFNGGYLTIQILNSSGGAMGAITWNAIFKLAGAFTNPANGQRRSITFHRTGGAWREISRTAADQPN